MNDSHIKNKCKSIRLNIQNAIAVRFQFGWFDEHIDSCPRCQQRINRLGNVDIALSVLKTQPHSRNLLANANTKATNVLKHSLRYTSKADKLRVYKPQPNWVQRNSRVLQSIVNVAACVTVVVLIKIGVFSSIHTFQDESKGVLEGYYSQHLDSEEVREILS